MYKTRKSIRVAIGWVFLSLPLVGMSDVQIDVQLERVTLPILTNGEEIVLAASFEYGTYGEDGMNTEGFQRIFQEVSEETAVKHPEYIAFQTFQYIHTGNAVAYYELYDPHYTRKQVGGIDDVKKGVDESKDLYELIDLKLLSKSRFGPFVRIDHKAVFQHKEAGDLSEKEMTHRTAFYYVHHDERYYRTREIGRVSLFGKILDFATQNSTERIQSEGVELSREFDSLHVDVNEELEPGSRVIYSQDSRSLEVDEDSGNAFSDGSLVLHYDFSLLDWHVADQEDERVPFEYRDFLMELLDAYRLRDEERIVGLWTEREGRGERSRIESMKERGVWPERAAPLILEDTIIKVLAETDHGAIIICESGRSSGRSLYTRFIVRDEEGNLRLSRNLGENYAGTIFRDAEFLDAVLNQIADNGAE